jgi:hypothetical protein
MIIYCWADGTWCTEDDIEEMTHMSDDYGTFTSFATDEEIEEEVRQLTCC